MNGNTVGNRYSTRLGHNSVAGGQLQERRRISSQGGGVIGKGLVWDEASHERHSPSHRCGTAVSQRTGDVLVLAHDAKSSWDHGWDILSMGRTRSEVT